MIENSENRIKVAMYIELIVIAWIHQLCEPSEPELSQEIYRQCIEEQMFWVGRSGFT